MQFYHQFEQDQWRIRGRMPPPPPKLTTFHRDLEHGPVPSIFLR